MTTLDRLMVAALMWDPDRWRPSTVRRRCRAWIAESRRRHRLAWVLAVLFVLFVFPGVVGAVATAVPASGSGAGSTGMVNSGLSWMGVTDSSGVPLSSYMFVTDRGPLGGLLNPGNLAMSLVIDLELAGWLVIVTTAIWLMGATLSLAWMDRFGTIVTGVVDSLTHQVPLPAMVGAGVAIGAVFVGWFITRGLVAKAAAQVVMMIVVSTLGPILLAHPMSEVLSSEGVLAQGRDVGVSVAAGLLGDNHPKPRTLTASLQTQLADNFARHPLQVWNFGYVIDDRPACKAVWTAGMNASDEEAVRNGLKSCFPAAGAATDRPSVGQLGAGLLLLIVGIVVIYFATVFSFRIMWASADVIYNGTVFLFWDIPFGGFIYGVTQTSMVRRLVDTGVAGVRLCANVVLLAAYTLFLGRMLGQAGGNVIEVFIIGVIVLCVGVVQLKRMNSRMTKTTLAIAERIGQSIQAGGVFAAAGASGGGGGMGVIGLANSLPASSGSGLVSRLAAFSVLANSPLTELAVGMRTPFRPFARLERAANTGWWSAQAIPGLAGPNGWWTQSVSDRELFARSARHAAESYGGLDTFQGIAAALLGLDDARIPPDAAWGALRGAGMTNDRAMFHLDRSWGIIDGNADTNPGAYRHIAHVVSAMNRAHTSASSLARGERGGTAIEVAADYASLQRAAFMYQRANGSSNVRLAPRERDFVQKYLAQDDDYYSKHIIRVVQGIADGKSLNALVKDHPDIDKARGKRLRAELAGIDKIGASRMMKWISNEESGNVMKAVNAAVDDPRNALLMREARARIAAATNTSHWLHDIPTTSMNTVTPPDPRNIPRARWGAAMEDVDDYLRPGRN
ncbi:hypothetical protein ACFYO1_02300 [Nocardia sp. NPDC006044]|uniref:hypothetical protein n=1 Tax=Nocardia sp. NPDC006044 TaxID=3364306 RepID=UPI00368FE839